jgi:two-component system, OmpR family, phosphate regulon sensor histidine kinase PhoR
MKRHLFYKIFGTYLILIILSVFVLHLFVRDEIKKTLTAKIEEELTTDAALIDLNSPQKISEQLNQISKLSKSRITIIDVKGIVTADSERSIEGLENHLNRPEVQESRVRGKGRSIRFSSSIGVDMLYIAIPIKDNSIITGYIRLARPLYEVRQSIENVTGIIFKATLVILAFSIILALLFSYWLTAPIKKMEKFTEKLRQGHPSGTIFLKTSDETKKLADNINYLVDELKNQLKSANEEKAKLVTAFSSMTEGILILDAGDRIEVVNPSLGNLLASQYGDIKGKTLMEAFRNVELQKAFLQFRATKQSVSQEITLGNIEPVILNISVSTVEGSSAEEKNMIIFHDITRLKKLERVRADFIANVTHEIRTPLTAILGYLETIKDGTIENKDQERKFMEIIINHAQRLNRLVEDLLTISKIELGEMNFHFEQVSLSDIITNVIPLIEPKANLKKIKIDNRIADKLQSITADKDKLIQVFVNILDNAVKFTQDAGEITIEAAEDAAKDGIAVSITDTGIGIPESEVARLGERFYRVDKTRSRDLGGTGLGLSIVKHLMIAHGGQLEIASQLGRGTKVSLHFPLEHSNRE